MITIYVLSRRTKKSRHHYVMCNTFCGGEQMGDLWGITARGYVYYVINSIQQVASDTFTSLCFWFKLNWTATIYESFFFTFFWLNVNSYGAVNFLHFLSFSQTSFTIIFTERTSVLVTVLKQKLTQRFKKFLEEACRLFAKMNLKGSNYW